MLTVNDQTPITTMTTPELHRHIQTWRRMNPQVSDISVALHMALAEICPDESPESVVFQSELNWLTCERTKEVKVASQNIDDWVDTKAQGDLFNKMPFSVPKIMLKDGKPAKYYEMTVNEMAEYLSALAQSTALQAAEFQKLAKDKQAKHKRIQASLDQVRKVIEEAKQNGIDPSGLYCANAG